MLASHCSLPDAPLLIRSFLLLYWIFPFPIATIQLCSKIDLSGKDSFAVEWFGEPTSREESVGKASWEIRNLPRQQARNPITQERITVGRRRNRGERGEEKWEVMIGQEEGGWRGEGSRLTAHSSGRAFQLLAFHQLPARR